MLRMPRPETEYTWMDRTAQSGAGTSFTSGGSFVSNIYACTGTDIEYEWARQEEHFREYIDEGCECPTRKKMDQATVELARLIHNYLATSNQMDMGEHKDMIFESAQRIVRTVML